MKKGAWGCVTWLRQFTHPARATHILALPSSPRPGAPPSLLPLLSGRRRSKRAGWEPEGRGPDLRPMGLF